MALDKNDGIFLPSIEGVVSGKTSQVDGMNGIMNNLIGNDNFLKDKKLDRGNYVGSGELLRKDDNGIWGGEFGGYIQDPIPKELNKRYIDNINGKAFICIKAGDSSVVSNTIEYFTPCNVVGNLDKLNNIKNFFENSDFGLDVGIFKTYKTGRLNNSSESQQFPVGTYIFSAPHGGRNNQNYLSFISLTGYSSEDVWKDVVNLNSGGTSETYKFQFNPYKRAIRNVSSTEKGCYLINIGVSY